jgi:hypothetical protein
MHFEQNTTHLKIDERFNTDESAQVRECGCDGTSHPTELERVKLTERGNNKLINQSVNKGY